ncbi:hypothetical protein EA58_03505 [Photobacterium galatheae]|uniref:N-acetyltransferase domain-containing protein n=1 Tax=Photobacterium galatheae TaxID=1654360 RepID=A0A066RUQ6_9GAMM|nr:hypothetical protein EA58_03505 [Photobacterium galatheae]
MELQLATEHNLDGFFAYLDKHLRENGLGSTPLFQPVSVEASKLTPELEQRFRLAVPREINDLGWRKLFVATKSDAVIGHIDIRPYPDRHTEHRVLLGMGVDAVVRGQGLGTQLITFLIDWVRTHTAIEYIDLWVLSENHAAKALYRKCGFIKCGEIEDKFRIDGKSHAYTMMSLTVNRKVSVADVAR